MNRREFLDLLRYYLRNYPVNIINDIVADYEEHFRIGIENGKIETEIAAELGSPKDIADEFLSHEIPPYPNRNPNMSGMMQMNATIQDQTNPPVQPKQTSSWVLALLLVAALIFFAPVGLGLFVSFIGVIVSLLAAVLALGVSGIVSLFSWILPIGHYVRFFGYRLHPVTSVIFGIFLVCLSILFGYLTFLLLGACIKGIKNLYLSIRWKIAKRRRQ